MSTFEIILTVLSSSILTTILTLAGSWYFTRVSFQNEYYKEIIKKRLQVYDDLVKVSSALTVTIVEDETGRSNYFIFTSGATEYYRFVTLLTKCVESQIWINPDTYKILGQLTNTIVEVSRAYSITLSSPSKEVKKAGADYYGKISRDVSEFTKLISKDLLTLYNVEGFLKNR